MFGSWKHASLYVPDLAIGQQARALLSPVPCPAALEANMVGVLVPLQVVCAITGLRQEPAEQSTYVLGIIIVQFYAVGRQHVSTQCPPPPTPPLFPHIPCCTRPPPLFPHIPCCTRPPPLFPHIPCYTTTPSSPISPVVPTPPLSPYPLLYLHPLFPHIPCCTTKEVTAHRDFCLLCTH